MTAQAPLILGFDTSSAACHVGLIRGEKILADHVEKMSKGQAERLMGLCAEVLRDANVAPGDLDALGVGVGPGNFTGIRISVSAARGLALGLGIPAVGVSAFDALRHGQSGPCACAVDARREEVYLQCFAQDGAIAAPIVSPLDQLPDFEGPLIGQGGIAPRYTPAIAICLIANERFGQTLPRPTPLYIRPADAAPARDAPPKMLT